MSEHNALSGLSAQYPLFSRLSLWLSKDIIISYIDYESHYSLLYPSIA